MIFFLSAFFRLQTAGWLPVVSHAVHSNLAPARRNTVLRVNRSLLFVNRGRFVWVLLLQESVVTCLFVTWFATRLRWFVTFCYVLLLPSFLSFHLSFSWQACSMPEEGEGGHEVAFHLGTIIDYHPFRWLLSSPSHPIRVLKSNLCNY